MTDKENALRVLRFDHPERAVGGLGGPWVCYTGCNHESFDGIGNGETPVGTVWTDIWGTVWQQELPGIMGFPRQHPLAEIQSLRSYCWPDPNDERICGAIYSGAKGSNGGDFLTGSHRQTLWEKA